MSQIMLEDPNSQLARLVQQAIEGEEVIILRDSIPVARLVPLPEWAEKPQQGGFGSGKDDILYMADDFMRRWKISRNICDADFVSVRHGINSEPRKCPPSKRRKKRCTSFVPWTVSFRQPRNLFRGGVSISEHRA